MFLDYRELAIARASIATGIRVVWSEAAAQKVRERTPWLVSLNKAHS